MDGPRRGATSMLTLAAAAAVVLSACGHGSPPKAAPSPAVTGRILPTLIARTLPGGSNLPPCQMPARLALPSWVPPDLPLPAGTYTSQLLPDATGYHRAILVVPGSLVDMTRFILDQWPKSGWILGRGESEPGEVEDQFAKPPAIGAFKAQSQFCSPGYNLMLLIYTPDRASLPTPGTQPSSPLPTATASPSS